MRGKLHVQLPDRIKKRNGDNLGKEWELTRISKTQWVMMTLQKVENYPERSECSQVCLGEIKQTVTFSELREVVTGPCAAKFSEMF